MKFPMIQKQCVSGLVDGMKTVTIFSAVPAGLGVVPNFPGVKTPGYCRVVPPGQLRWLKYIVSVLVLAATVGGVRGDSVTLNPSADTSLFEPNPNNNLGGSSSLASGS